MNQPVETRRFGHLVSSLLLISGATFILLALLFPLWMDSLREHGGTGVSAVFGPGPDSIKEALNSVASAVSIVASIGIAAVMFLFERARHASLLLGVVTLWIYSGAIMFSLYLSVLRPLTGNVPSLLEVGTLLGLIPLGVAFTIFTLASVLRNQTATSVADPRSI